VVSSVLSPVALMVPRGRFINPNRCAKHIRSPFLTAAPGPRHITGMVAPLEHRQRIARLMPLDDVMRRIAERVHPVTPREMRAAVALGASNEGDYHLPYHGLCAGDRLRGPRCWRARSGVTSSGTPSGALWAVRTAPVRFAHRHALALTVGLPSKAERICACCATRRLIPVSECAKTPPGLLRAGRCRGADQSPFDLRPRDQMRLKVSPPSSSKRLA
jgi:hypothetical protein